ncbi:MAG: PEP-CTERM sorting domain-containing protein [Thermodesulfobacteriota bacterium]
MKYELTIGTDFGIEFIVMPQTVQPNNQEAGMRKVVLMMGICLLWVAVSFLPVWAVAGPEGSKGGGGDQETVECRPPTTKPPTSGKVPEPLTMALLAVGGAGAVALRKRSKK